MKTRCLILYRSNYLEDLETETFQYELIYLNQAWCSLTQSTKKARTSNPLVGCMETD